MGLAVSSCEDFLTLMPLNEVVLENYWTEGADVESVLRGAYAALESSECLLRMAAWGEFRSDNIVSGTDNTQSSDEMNKFIDENINENNEITTYLCFYKTINYANTVLHFAPEVHKKDPNYRGGNLRAHQAEAIAIRSLCYWYLIRAFRDVPYVTIPSIDDTHDFFIGQTKFEVILDSLINDLEQVKDNAWPHIKKDLTNAANSSRFTRAGIYAMLADMYLWKGDWDKCIECCKYVDNVKRADYQTLFDEKGTGCNITLVGKYDKYPLINGADADKQASRAYNEIFGTGNSFESLFELPYGSDRSNGFVSDYYNDGSNPDVGRVKAYTPIGKIDNSSVFLTPCDSRYYEDLLKTSNGTDYGIVKYVYQKMDYKLEGTSPTYSGKYPGTFRQSNSASPNWVIYRYSEVLLMQAEARVMKAKVAGETTIEGIAQLDTAFQIVNAIYNRAICKDVNTTAPSLDQTKYTTVETMEKLVFDERRREFLFEGKRWFDLVRLAMRNGNSKDVFTAVQGKYEGNTRSIEIKFNNPYGLFLPINKEEIKINDKLKQNPAYQRTEEVIQKAK